ncbi:hypothetical protein [Ruminococcus albus]|nr:hypothetical protein [Ruminococcus albus]
MKGRVFMTIQKLEELYERGPELHIDIGGATTFNELSQIISDGNKLISLLADNKLRDFIKQITEALQLELDVLLINDVEPEDIVTIGRDRGALTGEGAAEIFRDYFWQKQHIAHFREATVKTVDGSTYTILAGSKINMKPSKSNSAVALQVFKELKNSSKVTADGILIDDVELNSKSAVASLISGVNTNGTKTPLGELV